MDAERCRNNKLTAQYVLCLPVLVLLALNPLLAQEKSGSLNGTTFDESGAVLPGVAVTVTNKVTNRTISAGTGADGAYIVPNLEPGHYSVKFELPSFSPLNF